jgi:Uma2 family endonuclease
MSARPTAELVTVEELLQLPNPKEGHYELHHGEVVLMPPPKWGHQRIQERIQMAIARVARERGVVMAEMAFRPLPEHEVWQADVGFISTGRAERIQEDEYLAGAPDLVVEVLSQQHR